jgi:hypothetical protein
MFICWRVSELTGFEYLLEQLVVEAIESGCRDKLAAGNQRQAGWALLC